MVAILAETCRIDSIESTKEPIMTIHERVEALREAAQAFRKAWSLMDAAIGYEASSDLGETCTLQDVIRILESEEYIGVAE
jgi:hypothetical protein